MKINGLLLATFLTTAVVAVGQSTANPSASPDNDRGASTYGNGTYNSGSHQQSPGSMNSGATEHPSAQSPASDTDTNRTSGTPNASHTSSPAAESGETQRSTETNPSATSPGNGNSPGSAPPNSGGSNTGVPPQMNIAAYHFDGARLVNASQQQQGGAAGQMGGQASSAQQSPSANSVNNPDVPQAPSPDANNDAALQSRIDDALRNEPTLGASHVVSKVTDSGIELSGTVGSTKDKQTAERIASSFDGNRKLTDNIVVTGAGHSDLAPNHPAMNNGGTGNVQNPAMNNGTNNPKK